MAATVDYYLSLNSPWSYLGHERFTAMTDAANATVVMHPVDFRVIFPATGGLPVPERSPQRQAYRLMELERWREHLRIPLNLHPAHWPADDKIVTALTIALRAQGEDAMGFAGAVMRAVWAEQRDIADRATVVDIANACGLDGEALLDGLDPTPWLATRDEESRAAIEIGVFGAPSYVIDGEVFWGQDRLDFVQRKLSA